MARGVAPFEVAEHAAIGAVERAAWLAEVAKIDARVLWEWLARVTCLTTPRLCGHGILNRRARTA
eukprot:CAMPEP_0174743650 /NCGR_PEP_ID=MMETSP1094-20130205/82160_1 /TAXON_ID=156173 /ORGANISM="Chrysochromulina brevifilum, Strain UTEX LB 985" /LENGTH=64 /DNA_ID=CAMNT_0015947903 /DNA_START=143 /DNA_END=334 /DNA_ORIENTATION=-